MCMIISQLLYTVNNNLLIGFVLFLCWEFYCTDNSFATDLYSRVMFYFFRTNVPRGTFVFIGLWIYCGGQSRPSFLGSSHRITATVSAVASLSDYGRSNIFTPIERAWTLVCPRSEIFYCRAHFGSLLCSYSSLCILALRLGD